MGAARHQRVPVATAARTPRGEATRSPEPDAVRWAVVHVRAGTTAHRPETRQTAPRTTRRERTTAPTRTVARRPTADTSRQHVPSPPARRYPHASDARIGTGARRRRRRGDQTVDRGKPPARGGRGGDSGGRAGMTGQVDGNRPGRHHAGRDDAAAGRLGDGGAAAPVTGYGPHQG